MIMGAGGYTLEPESRLIDLDFMVRMGKRQPRVCLLPTACGDRQETIERFHKQFQSYGAATSHLSLFDVEIEDMERYLLQQDGIYITGGNTKSMLALWTEWGIDEALRKAHKAGIAICGISAGAICFFEEGLSDSFANRAGPLRCMGLLEGSFCPHYVPGGKRALAFQEHIRNGSMKPGIGIEDGVALCYEHGKLTAIIRSRAEAKAYRIDPAGRPKPVEI